MDSDIDFAQRRGDFVRARRRVRLSFLALLACVIMMADLISGAGATVRAQQACEVPARDPVTVNSQPAVKSGPAQCH